MITEATEGTLTRSDRTALGRYSPETLAAAAKANERAERDKARAAEREPEPEALHYDFLTCDDLMEQKEPGWLVYGLLPEDSLAEVFAAPDSFKSFLALALACSVATGVPFIDGRAIEKQGDVIYVAGEGQGGIRKRVRAWWEAHDRKPERLRVIPEPVDVPGDGPDKLIEDINRLGLKPVLIVLDTLARCFCGRNENSTQDMNLFVAGCDKLRWAFPGCTVLIIHHTGWEKGEHGRGSSGLYGALDTEIKMQRLAVKDTAEVVVTKQKDWGGEGKTAFVVRLRDVKLSKDSKSAVLEGVAPEDVSAMREAAKHTNDEKVLAVLRQAGTAGLKRSELEKKTGIKHGTIGGVLNRLRGKINVSANARWTAI